jgi:hypothetical protein
MHSNDGCQWAYVAEGNQHTQSRFQELQCWDNPVFPGHYHYRRPQLGIRQRLQRLYPMDQHPKINNQEMKTTRTE